MFNSPPLLPVMSRIKVVHILSSNVFDINFNSISSSYVVQVVSWCLPTKTLCIFLLSFTHAACPSRFTFFDLINLIIVDEKCEVQIIKFLFMQSSPLCCFVIPLRPKNLPQRPILKHPQPLLISWCERQSLISVYNKSENKQNPKKRWTESRIHTADLLWIVNLFIFACSWQRRSKLGNVAGVRLTLAGWAKRM